MPTTMKRYALQFGAAYAGLLVTLGVVAQLLAINAASAIGVAALLGASCFAAARFVKEQSRAPTREETGRFALAALLVSWLVSVLLLAVATAFVGNARELQVLLNSMKSPALIALAVGVVALVSLLYYGAIRLSFGWYARLASARRAA